MRHSKEDVEASLNYLMKFSKDKNYAKNLIIMFDYIEDMVKVTQEASQIADGSIKTLQLFLEKLIDISKDTKKYQDKETFKELMSTLMLSKEIERTMLKKEDQKEDKKEEE